MADSDDGFMLVQSGTPSAVELSSAGRSSAGSTGSGGSGASGDAARADVMTLQRLLRDGVDWYQKREYRMAKPVLNEALQVALRLGDKTSEGRALANLASVHKAERGDHAKALELYARAIELFRELDDRSRLATTLSNAAFSHEKLGQLAEAASLMQEKLDLVTDAGVAEKTREEVQRLRALSKDSVPAPTEAERASVRASMRESLAAGIKLLNEGQYPRSEEQLERAASLAKELADTHSQARCLGNLAQVRRPRGLGSGKGCLWWLLWW